MEIRGLRACMFIDDGMLFFVIGKVDGNERLACV